MKKVKLKSLQGRDVVFEIEKGNRVKVWVNKQVTEDNHLTLFFNAFDAAMAKPEEDPYRQVMTETIHRDGLADVDIDDLIEQTKRTITERYNNARARLSSLADVPEWTKD